MYISIYICIHLCFSHSGSRGSDTQLKGDKTRLLFIFIYSKVDVCIHINIKTNLWFSHSVPHTVPHGSDTRLNRAQHDACYVRETEYTHIYIYNTNIHNTPERMFVYVYVYIYTHICALDVCFSREGHAAQPRNDMLHTRARVNMRVATLERHRL